MQAYSNSHKKDFKEINLRNLSYLAFCSSEGSAEKRTVSINNKITFLRYHHFVETYCEFC